MLQPYPTPPRRATGQALWSYLYQLAEQLNAQAAPAAASETAAPNGGSAARIAAEARQTAANALAVSYTHLSVPCLPVSKPLAASLALTDCCGNAGPP